MLNLTLSSTSVTDCLNARSKALNIAPLPFTSLYISSSTTTRKRLSSFSGRHCPLLSEKKMVLFSIDLFMPRYFTKTRFSLALDCSSKLYYSGKPEYIDTKNDDAFLAALAEGGFQVGELARCYFEGGHPDSSNPSAGKLKKVFTSENSVPENYTAPWMTGAKDIRWCRRNRQGKDG